MSQIFTKKDFKTTRWAGGKTTELFIFPENSSFKERNFSFRLSTASVEVEESVFTALPEVKRALMVLEGEMELTHVNQHSKVLKKFDVDHFNGSWETLSKGKCTDFNLMTKGNIRGVLESVRLEKGAEKEYELFDQNKMSFIYLIKGGLEINLEKEKLKLATGNLLFMESLDCFKVTSSYASEYVIITISLN